MAPVDARRKLEQIRRNKGKDNTGARSVGGNVKDLRQLIAGKTSRVAAGRIVKSQASIGGVRDLRETNRKLAARKNLSQQQQQPHQIRNTYQAGASTSSRFVRTSFDADTRPPAHNTRSSVIARPFKAGRQQQQYYVPPHLQHSQAPTYIIAPAPAPAQSNLAMDKVQEAQGASILISNLQPGITQSDIIELFGDIGVMTAVNMINPTTALVTYRESSDAVKAVKVYHNRLLDGKPMMVNMMPNTATPTTTSNVRSRVGYTSSLSNQAAPMEITPW